MAASVRPRVFIGCSAETLAVAKAIRRELATRCDCVPWDEATQIQGMSVLESILRQIDTFDYAIFVYGPDDVADIRGERFLVARDNVILEHGMFLSKLGREHVYFLLPRLPGRHTRTRVPTNLSGVIHDHYDYRAGSDASVRAVRAFCRNVWKTIRAREKDWITKRWTCRVWEQSSIGGASITDGKPSMSISPARRIIYKPARTTVRVSRKTGEVRLRFSLDALVSPSGSDKAKTSQRFAGPAAGRGRLENGCAYVIYEWIIDAKTGDRIVGLCMIRMTHSSLEAYWLSNDWMRPGAAILGGAVAP